MTKGKNEFMRRKSIKIGIAILILLSNICVTPQQIEAKGLTSLIMPSVESTTKSIGNTNVHIVSAKKGDSSNKIQSLLDLNKDGAYGKLVVKIPAGDYYFDKTLYVYSNTTLILEEGAKVHKQKAYGAIIEGKLISDNGGYDGCKNIVIDGGVWDASAMMNQKGGTEQIRFIHASNIVIRNAEFSNISEGSHFVVFAGVQNGTIENCSFHGYGNDGDSYRNPKEAIQLDIVHNNKIVPTAQKVKWDDLPCKNITIRNCEFYDYSRAIGSHTTVAGVYHEGIVIKDNIIHDMEEVAIRLYQYKDSVISGNTITNCATGIMLYTRTGFTNESAYYKPLNGIVQPEPEKTNVVLEGNTIKNMLSSNKEYGNAIHISGITQLPISYIIVKDNQIYNVEQNGIFVTGTNHVEVSENVIRKSKKYGILFERNNKNEKIINNKVRGAEISDIFVLKGSSMAEIIGNKK